jgi:hypothetical protein
MRRSRTPTTTLTIFCAAESLRLVCVDMKWLGANVANVHLQLRARLQHYACTKVDKMAITSAAAELIYIRLTPIQSAIYEWYYCWRL